MKKQLLTCLFLLGQVFGTSVVYGMSTDEARTNRINTTMSRVYPNRNFCDGTAVALSILTGHDIRSEQCAGGWHPHDFGPLQPADNTSLQKDIKLISYSHMASL